MPGAPGAGHREVATLSDSASSLLARPQPRPAPRRGSRRRRRRDPAADDPFGVCSDWCHRATSLALSLVGVRGAVRSLSRSRPCRRRAGSRVERAPPIAASWVIRMTVSPCSRHSSSSRSSIVCAGVGVEVAGRLVGEQHVAARSRALARSRRAAARRPRAGRAGARRASASPTRSSSSRRAGAIARCAMSPSAPSPPRRSPAPSASGSG